jgi:hypothetical protein
MVVYGHFSYSHAPMFCFVGAQVFDGSKKILTTLLTAALFVPASLPLY